MKKAQVLLGIAAAAVVSLVSCQKESSKTPQENRMVDIVINAGPDAMTKTVLQGDGSVLWGEGEKLIVLQTVDSNTSAAVSSDGVTNDGGQTMTFGVSFEENTEATSFTYNAVYPASAWTAVGDDENTNATALRTIFPATQKPTASSFDAAADLLIAKTQTVDEQPTSLSLSFQRMVAVGKMTINNLASESNVKEIVFTAMSGEETASQPILAGRNRFNLNEGTAEYGYNSPVNAITLDYAGQTIAANGMTAYFTSCPFELGEGDSFKVAVTTEDGKIYSKTITLTAGKSLAFKAGRASKFSVSMVGAEEETLSNLEGKYIFVGKTSTDWRYMKNEVSSGSTAYLIAATTNVTKSDIDLTSSAIDFPSVSEYWEVVKYGDNYAIKGASGTYVSWTTGNSATLAGDPYELKLTEKDNGSYLITSVGDATRSLRFNSGSPRFAFYTSAQTDVYMIPYEANTAPYIEANQTSFDVPAAGGEYSIVLTCQNLTGEVTAVASEEWIDISYAGDDEVDFEVVANTGEARNATITISSDGATDVVVTINQLAASGNDGSTPEKAFTASEAYAFVSSMTAGQTSSESYYVKGIISSIKYTFSAQYGTATFDFSDDGETTSTQFIAYSTYYFNNEAWVSGNTQIKVGDEVIVYGQVVNYGGNTPEFASKKSHLYSLNGKTNDEYTITVNASTNGTVTASAETAVPGTEITLTVTPETGYVLNTLSVVDALNKTISVTDNKFIMPSADVTVSATFKEIIDGATTATIKFGTNDVKINASSVTGDDDQGNTWTITTEGTTSFTPNAAYCQVGSSSKPATSITFTTTLPEGTTKVDALSIKLGGFSGTAGDVTLEVGSTTVGTGSLNATNDVTVSSTSSADGRAITITVDNISKGVKVYNITAEYE